MGPIGQAILIASGTTWRPMRGIHRGHTCMTCGEAARVMYAATEDDARAGNVFCPDDRPSLEATT